MKISLRKANQLDNELRELINAVPLATAISLNEFEPLEQQLGTARQTLQDSITRRLRLSRARYAIRQLVGVANNTFGIDDLLTRAAELEQELIMLGELTSAAPRQNTAVLAGRLDRQSTAEARLYRDTVQSGVLTVEEIDLYKKQQRKVKQDKVKINDSILHANVSGSIQLDETTIAVLNEENLL